MATFQTYTTTVTEHRFLNAKIMEIRLALPPSFVFQPGQFIQVIIPGTQGKVTRSYSIASIQEDGYIELCIKITPGGTTETYFQHLKPGNTIEFRGPIGQFTNTNTGSLGFVATGVGLAPIMGILRNELLKKNNSARIHLWFGVRSESDIFWVERLETLARDFSEFTYTLTLSGPSETWNGSVGRVTEHVTNHELKEAHWFLCGSKPMVQEVKELLKIQTVPDKNIHVEIF